VPRYILLDRDGVINRRKLNGYVTSWEQFEFLPRALDALRLLAEGGYRALVVSNQACVSKGLISSEGLAELTRRFVEEVEKHGGHIDRVYYCPHQNGEGCDCRKPKPGLLLQAQREYLFAFAEAFLVGDSEPDLMAAQQVGCPAILVRSGGLDTQAAPYAGETPALPGNPRATVRDLYEAVQFILGGEGE
jgi:D-glycero-D-manno-heptose 1,7-bisphosphate phosphatase